jgi:toxin ParE1/3/4
VRVRLTRKADSDLTEILRWGSEHFGADAADEYYLGLMAVIDLLAENPRIAHEIRDGVRAHPHRSHVIVYRESEGRLDILTVRHGRSNWRKHL